MTQIFIEHTEKKRIRKKFIKMLTSLICEFASFCFIQYSTTNMYYFYNQRG